MKIALKNIVQHSKNIINNNPLEITFKDKFSLSSGVSVAFKTKKTKKKKKKEKKKKKDRIVLWMCTGMTFFLVIQCFFKSFVV